jgi:hypothetical protein
MQAKVLWISRNRRRGHYRNSISALQNTEGNMTRREMFDVVGKSAVSGGLATLSVAAATSAAEPQRRGVPLPPPPEQLPGTTPLTMPGDMAAQMVAGMGRYLD